MTIIKFPSKQAEPPFFDDIVEDGYHIFSLKNAKIPNYYPNEFPAYPSVPIKDMKIGDKITVRVFFRVGEGDEIRADGGYIDLEVEHLVDDSVSAVIVTQLPKEFSLGTGDSIDVYQEEILYRTEVTDH